MYPRRCRNCLEHRPRPLTCSKMKEPRRSTCRYCRVHGLPCIDPDVIIVQPPPSQTSNSSHVLNSQIELRGSPTGGNNGLNRFVAINEPRSESDHPHDFNMSSMSTTDNLAGNVRKVLISLDVGSGNIKAAWKAIFDRAERRALVDSLCQECRPIIWDNGQAHCPAQLAYKVCEDLHGRRVLRQIWGVDVDNELEMGNIADKDVLKWLKPAIFSYGDERDVGARVFHKDQLQERIGYLQTLAQEKRVHSDLAADTKALDLYSDLIGHAYRFVQQRIAEEYPRLISHLGGGCYEWRDGLQVEVALPVPANSLPKHVKMVLQAAKRAGLPLTFLVAEPSAAIAYYLQQQTETKTDQRVTSSQTILLLDAGEGSLDAILCSVEPQPDIEPATEERGSPEIPNELMPNDRFVLKEEIAGATEWSGGSFANQACKEWLTSTFDSRFREMLVEPHWRRMYQTKANIVEKLVKDFELKKKRFSRSAEQDSIQLSLPGFPPGPVNSNHGNFIRIDRAVLMRFFERQLESSLRLINKQMAEFEKRNQHLNRIREVDQVILVGGGNESRYIREAIKTELANILGLMPTHAIDIRQPQMERFNTLTARGSVLLLEDKEFVGERVIRRGYCVKWDKPTTLKRSTESLRISRDAEDGHMCMVDVSKFLLRPGDRISYSHKIRHRGGWRALAMHPDADDAGFDFANNCFLIEEILFYADRTCRDDLWVYFRDHRIHEAGKIVFELDRQICNSFTETYTHGGKHFWRVEYEVSIEIVGLDFRYKIIIPETGVFDGESYRSYGSNPIEKEGRLRWEDDGGLCVV